MKKPTISVLGSGYAALCAAVAVREKGATVQAVEKTDEVEAGGNSQYTAGAMRFAYAGKAGVPPLLAVPGLLDAYGAGATGLYRETGCPGVAQAPGDRYKNDNSSLVKMT